MFKISRYLVKLSVRKLTASSALSSWLLQLRTVGDSLGFAV